MPSSSTNPFDDDSHNAAEEKISSTDKQHQQQQVRSYRPPQQQQQQIRGKGKKTSTNPFDSFTTATTTAETDSYYSDAKTKDVPIFASRVVDWPIPSTLSSSIYHKLVSSEHATTTDETTTTTTTTTASYYVSGLFKNLLQAETTTKSPQLSTHHHKSLEMNQKYFCKPPHLRCVASSNGWIVCVMDVVADSSSSDNVVLRIASRWNVRRSSSAQEDMLVSIPSSSDIIRHVFIDPTGHHALLSSINGHLYHLHSSYNQVHLLPTRCFSHSSFVTSVAWDRERGTEMSTKKILLGTSNGCIYEYSITVSANTTTTTTTTNKSNINIGEMSSVEHEGVDSIVGNATPVTTAVTSATSSSVVPVCLVDLNSVDFVHPNNSITTCTTLVGAVTGLHVERLTAGRIFILLVTSGIHHPTRLYTFCSAPNNNNDSAYHSAFYGQPASSTSSYNKKSTNASNAQTIMELPGSISFASVKVCQHVFAISFGSGIYYGSFPTTQQSTLVDTGMIPSSTHIVDIAITPHHIIMANLEGTVSFINRISHKIIQQEHAGSGGSSIVSSTYSHNSAISSLREALFHGEFLMDPRRPDQVWLRQSRSLLHISSMNEDRNVWRYALERCLDPNSSKTTSIKVAEESFEKVKLLCSTQAQKSVVGMVRGEYFLEARRRPDIAARYLSQAPSVLCPFSKTALRLALPSFKEVGVSYGEQNTEEEGEESNALFENSLQSYLADKLRLAIAAKDSVSCAMLGAWLTELQLHSLNVPSAKTEKTDALKSFLTTFAETLDARTTISILQSHDINANVCAPYAAASGDIPAAVNAALSGSEGKIGALDALRVLNDSPIEKSEPCYYKHAYLLLCRAPMQSCKCFLSRYSQGLLPTKLLPSLMAYERRRSTERERLNVRGRGLKAGLSKESDYILPDADSAFTDDEHAVIKYLEGVIKSGCRSVAIYNYLVLLYASLEDEVPLFRFLSSLIPNAASSRGNNPFIGNFDLGCPLDMSYALRKILKTGRHYRSAVKLYMGFGLRQQAVELSLKVDPALARELARESVGKDERKRLWLMIARNAAAEHEHGSEGKGNVVEKVVSVLKDCGPDVLSIEDVLPFLPDFAQIDQFKDEICEALTAYSSKIDQYLQEMSECDQACNALRDEVARLGKNEMQMRADARCAFSKKRVIEADEPFYVFPSGYVVLETPLKQEVLPYLNAKQRGRVEEIEVAIASMRSKTKGVETMSLETRQLYDKLQAELNGLIAAECPLTGNIMIESLDVGFSAVEDGGFDLESFLKKQ